MIKIEDLPELVKHELGSALAHANASTVIKLIKDNNIDLNSVFDSDSSRTILHEAVIPLSEYHSSDNQIRIIEYLISNGANLSLKNSNGFNPLHIALEYHSLAKVALVLITSNTADINAAEKNGNSLVFTAIREYGKTWRNEQKDVNQLRFKIIEELLNRGANLDQLNNHGINSRRWLDIYDDEQLNNLISRFE